MRLPNFVMFPLPSYNIPFKVNQLLSAEGISGIMNENGFRNRRV
ncbi:hypothetical protein ADIS_3332 [Lunatimonas lonarensis]|uniref:Uncharacterized protein n=1 Tax=Lunatimonas lonarensis TaxID=1232681 RepID=R7ZQB9_9BACT|nr:hypothetical protein ADIS_3332 [Lunatimonas lonarensis]